MASVVGALLGGHPVSAAHPLGDERPVAPMSPDGLQASDGQRTLRVGQAQGLVADGQVVGVSGSGYDASKGIYVALCVVTPADTPPSPCGGGIDQTGETGASAWVSSNPPSYGVGLATPYGAGGTFSVNVTAAAVIAPGYDCRRIQCAIVTRNDHVRTADRTQDLFVPVTFGADPAAPAPTTAPAATTAPATTVPPTTIAPPPVPTTTAPAPAPTIEVAPDGLSATDGSRTLRASTTADLDPAGATVTITGEGFDATKGVQVTLCRAPTSPVEAAAQCLAGATPDASRVVAPAAQAEGTDVVAFSAGGSFAVELEVAAVIDDETDCREVACALVVRRYALTDDEAAGAAADRTLDMALPVAFARTSPEATTTTTDDAEPADERAAGATPVADVDGGGGGGAPLAPLAVALAVVAAGGAALVVRRRHGSAT